MYFAYFHPLKLLDTGLSSAVVSVMLNAYNEMLGNCCHTSWFAPAIWISEI